MFDTPGLLSRSSKLLQAACKKWYPSKSYTSYPKKIILPEEFWLAVNKISIPLYTSFITNLTTYLNPNITTMNTNTSFNAYTNTTEGISAYLGLTCSNITNYYQY